MSKNQDMVAKTAHPQNCSVHLDRNSVAKAEVQEYGVRSTAKSSVCADGVHFRFSDQNVGTGVPTK